MFKDKRNKQTNKNQVQGHHLYKGQTAEEEKGRQRRSYRMPPSCSGRDNAASHGPGRGQEELSHLRGNVTEGQAENAWTESWITTRQASLTDQGRGLLDAEGGSVLGLAGRGATTAGEAGRANPRAQWRSSGKHRAGDASGACVTKGGPRGCKPPGEPPRTRLRDEEQPAGAQSVLCERAAPSFLPYLSSALASALGGRRYDYEEVIQDLDRLINERQGRSTETWQSREQTIIVQSLRLVNPPTASRQGKGHARLVPQKPHFGGGISHVCIEEGKLMVWHQASEGGN